MKAYFLTERAREDIKDIGRYTERVWGVRQSNGYLRKLHQKFVALAERPLSGAPRADIGPEFRSASTGSHIVVFRCVADGIEIARVLHGRMDIKSRMSGNT